MAQLIEQATTSTSRKENDRNEERSARISARTARRWLRRLGLEHKRVSKGVFVDGHDRGDAVRHRQGVPTPTIDRLRDCFAIWNSDAKMALPPNLSPQEKPHISVPHSESTFNANDGKRNLWIEKGKQPIRPKGKGKGIMVSDFITAGSCLMVS